MNKKQGLTKGSRAYKLSKLSVGDCVGFTRCIDVEVLKEKGLTFVSSALSADMKRAREVIGDCDFVRQSFVNVGTTDFKTYVTSVVTRTK
jgi:hypothetical protein